MRGLVRVWLFATLGLGAWLAVQPHLLLAADEVASLDAVASLDDGAAIAAWRAKLDEGHDLLLAAHQRLEVARDTYEDWRQRKYPRGVRKERLVREVSEAEAAVGEAQVAWQDLFEEARRAGVPPGVLRDYE